jgi:hypothetical protein
MKIARELIDNFIEQGSLHDYKKSQGGTSPAEDESYRWRQPGETFQVYQDGANYRDVPVEVGDTLFLKFEKMSGWGGTMHLSARSKSIRSVKFYPHDSVEFGGAITLKVKLQRIENRVIENENDVMFTFQTIEAKGRQGRSSSDLRYR